ncbi:MAG: RNA-binding S4 domain-containing protein [Saprospiraceae bacterium]
MDKNLLQKTRIDKWLWSVRIFKTRTLASSECRNNNVNIHDKKAKPSSLVSIDDEVYVSKNGFNLHFKVIKVIEKRVSATLASSCYKNLTKEEEMNKYKDWYVGKGRSEMRAKGAGRPTKKERRELDIFKDDIEFNVEL